MISSLFVSETDFIEDVSPDLTDDGVDAETSLSFFLSLFMSTSLLRLFSRAHYWVNKYILDLPPSLGREIRRNESVSGTGELRIKEENEHPAIILMFLLFLCGIWQAKCLKSPLGNDQCTPAR